MTELYFTTQTPVLNTQFPFKLHNFYLTNFILYSFLLTLTSTIPISHTDKENYFPSDNPNITNLLVSHYDCEKQHFRRQFNFVKP